MREEVEPASKYVSTTLSSSSFVSAIDSTCRALMSWRRETEQNSPLSTGSTMSTSPVPLLDAPGGPFRPSSKRSDLSLSLSPLSRRPCLCVPPLHARTLWLFAVVNRGRSASNGSHSRSSRPARAPGGCGTSSSHLASILVFRGLRMPSTPTLQKCFPSRMMPRSTAKSNTRGR